MPTQYKTPGVYIVEKNAFPPSIVAVETAVPAFVGYTEKAEFKGKPLKNVPFRLSSMSEFQAAFGGPPTPKFEIKTQAKGATAPAAPDFFTQAQIALVLAAPAAADKKLAQNEVDAIKAALPFVRLDSGLEDALDAVVVGATVAAESQPALDALKKALGAPPPALTATGNTTADQAAAIKTALTVVELSSDDAKALGDINAGTALSPEQKTSLATLNQALTAAASALPAKILENVGDTKTAWVQAEEIKAKRSSGFIVGTDEYKIIRTDQQFLLYYAMRQFFDNGGGPCWIVSVGDYKGDIELGEAGEEVSGLAGGISKLKDEIEPTMLVIPDAVRLDGKTCISLQQAMLKHCGYDMQNRFAILDIHDGDQPIFGGDSPVDKFRNALGVNTLNFGAAYYPWLNTTVVQDRDITYRNFLDETDQASLTASAQKLIGLVDAGFAAANEDDKSKEKRKSVVVSKDKTGAIMKLADFLAATVPSELTPEQQATINQVNQLLVATSEAFKTLRAEALRQVNVLPPSGAMAGLYTFVDNSRGVWKAPANVSINGVVSPTVPISHEAQAGLNVDPMGKSINAIRSFIGEGVLVWGARTLDGNSLDWRYINVRRTMIFLEESCKLAAKRMVFEPNVSSTWVTIKAMIESFLTSVWRQGGLAGAVPTDAFSVHVGLGDTMTADDILEGILRVTVLVAITRPAEFIEITFQQQLQKS